jgi:glycolate oxidase FAD binding subunit
MREILSRLVSAESLRPAAEASRWSVRDVQPAHVIAPSGAEEAAAVLSACSEHGWRVECAGAGTWLRQGRTPERIDVLLTTTRMSGITEYVPEDVTLGVQAGTAISSLAEQTAQHRQFAVLDGPAAAAATVGAMLATASAGPLRASAGTPRDQALGLEIVTGDGRVLRFGGRVVKNVAGYDIVRLFVGSHGTLGLITSAHLRLRALPELDAVVQWQNDGYEPLAQAATTIAALEPDTLEITGDGARVWHMTARFGGNSEAVDDSLRRAAAALPGMQRLPSTAETRSSSTSRGEAAAASQGNSDEADAGITIVLRAPVSALAATLREACRLAESARLVHPGIAAHAANGSVRVYGDAAESTPGRFTAALADARAAMHDVAGQVSVPVPPRGAESFEPWLVEPPALALMRRMKQVFDPAGILAPTRFIL